MIAQESTEISAIDQIRKGISAICLSGETYELRVPEAGKYKVVSGYYDNFHKMAFDALNLSDSRQLPAVYITLNPTPKDLLARSYNAAKDYAKYTTADKDIPWLRRFLVDLDVIRPSGISSTDEEHTLGLLKAEQVRGWLESQGWARPIMSDSGNGGHLIYAINLPNTPENVTLLKTALVKLNELFGDESVKVDTTTFSPAQVCKLPGTVARKGDDVPFRPHRRSYVIEAPDVLQDVSEEQLRALTGIQAKSSAGAFDRAVAEVMGNEVEIPDWVDDVPTVGTGVAWTQERLEEFLKSKGIEYRQPVVDGDRLKFVLEHCVFNESHAGKDAAIFLTVEGDDKGRLGYKCFHDSCSDKQWSDVREKLDPKAERKPTETTDTSWIDALTEGAGGDGANEKPFEEPKKENTEEPQRDPLEEFYLDIIRAKGIEAKPLPGKPEDTSYRYVVDSCPCCREPGLFLVDKKQMKRTYNCGGKNGVTWNSATAMWAMSKNKRRAYTLDELDELPTPVMHVAEHWPEGSLTMVYGLSGSFKTFFAVDIAMSIASGREFHGRKVKQGAVCYVLGEGQGGVKKRIRAWKHANGVTDDVPIVVIPAQFCLSNAGMAEAEEIVRLAREKLGCDPALVVIDTLNKHFGSGNENDTGDMTGFVNACGHIQADTGATVLVVHHASRDGGRERSNVALRNACDAIMSCELYGGKSGVTIECKKAKDHEEFEAYKLRAERVSTPDGDSLVLKSDDSPFAKDTVVESQLLQDAKIVRAYFPQGKQISKGGLVEEVQTGMAARGCQKTEIPGEKRIKVALAYLVDQGVVTLIDHANERHRKYALNTGASSGGELPDTGWFDDEIHQAEELA